MNTQYSIPRHPLTHTNIPCQSFARILACNAYFRESNILVSLMEEHGIGGGLGGKRNIQDPNLNPRWVLHVILTPFLFLVCFLQCGEIQGETGQTWKVPWRRRGLVKNDLKKGNEGVTHGSWFQVLTRPQRWSIFQGDGMVNVFLRPPLPLMVFQWF